MRATITVVSALLLGGCAIGGVVTISQPKICSGSVPVFEEQPGVFHVGSLSVSVKPQNADVSLLTAGLIVPVVPLGSGNKVRANMPFRLLVQFEHEGGNYSFAPASVVLVAKAASGSPASMQGPLTLIDHPRELDKTSVGHPWICGDRRLPYEKVEPTTDIVLPAKSCVVLEFSVPTQPPQEQFSVVLAGLRKEGSALPPFEIQFAPMTKVTGSWIGGQ